MRFARGDGYFVYWLRDDYQTLYVGYTENPSRRLKEHRRQKPWFPKITNVSIERYATRHEALKTEALAVYFGEDLYNVDLNERLADAAFADAQQGRHYPVLECYRDVPVRRLM